MQPGRGIWMVAPNILERTIATISPSWAFERRRATALLEVQEISRQFEAKYQTQVKELERMYSGASYGPLTENWHSNYNSARAEVSFDIKQLRNRMRDLVRNDGYAFAAINSLASNIIGKGIRPSFSAISEQGKTVKKKIQRPFLDWCGSKECDYVNELNFYGLQQLIIKGTAESGECLIVRRYTGRGKNTKLALQVLEVDFIVDWLTNSSLGKGFPEGTYCLNGVYYDKNARVYGYEVYEEHPGDSLKVRGYAHNFISADDAVLIYNADRPGQTRGTPWGASVMLEHKLLNNYELAQSHRQTIAASYAAFVKTMNPAEFGAPGPNKFTHSSEVNYRNMDGERIKPGSIQYLLPGEDVTLATPPPVDGYDEYIKSRLKKMARGWRLSYEVLSGDLSEVNFSSGRMGWLEMMRFIESVQSLIMIPKLCDVVFTWWIETEQLKGNFSFDISEHVRCDWTPPRREMIDPVKETKAMIDQMQAGLLAWADAVRQMGGDPDLQMDLIAETNDKLDKLKLVFISDYRNLQAQAMKGKIESSKDGLS